ncbi:MAG: hypothetical protein ABSG16_21860, partial [Candidatus Acidiferrum sp.]
DLFHILRFTPEGTLDLSLGLPTDNLFSNGFYLGPDDRIYARANRTLEVLTKKTDPSDLALNWEVLLPCSVECKISQSPSRRTLVIRDLQEQGHYTYTVLDISSGARPYSKQCPWIGFDANGITDEFSYQSGNGISWDVRRWPLCDKNREEELPLAMQSGFVSPLSDDLLVLLGTNRERRGIELIAPSGQLKFRQELPKNDHPSAEQARTDEHCDRIAFVVQTWRGGSRVLDISGKMIGRRIVVYTDRGQEVVSVPVSLGRNLVRYRRDFDFSLSPNGRRLAIVDEGELTIVGLN